MQGAFLNPLQVLSHLSVRPGMQVADFGAGSGVYTEHLLDKMSGEGAVYAFDVEEGHVEALHTSSVRRRISNLFSLCVDLNRHLPLKDAMLHCSVLANTFHALSARSQFLSELHRVTRLKGRVLFIDWAASFNNMGPTSEAAIVPGEAVRLFRANGFEVGTMLPAGTHHYAFIATKV